MVNGDRVKQALSRLMEQILKQQQKDGSWHYAFEGGIVTDVYMIILLTTMRDPDWDFIRRLASRIAKSQQEKGFWRMYEDDTDGGLSVTVQAYLGLRIAHYYHMEDEEMRAAYQYIVSKGGLDRTDMLTKIILSITGIYDWSKQFRLPVEFMLLPDSAPLHFFQFSSYARIHLAPLMILADDEYVIGRVEVPELVDLQDQRKTDASVGAWIGQSAFQSRDVLKALKEGLETLGGLTDELHQTAMHKAEKYMLDRIDPRGLLYSYSTASVLMIFALLALKYDKGDPLIMKAVQGLRSYSCLVQDGLHIQNSPSVVWDTALLSRAVREAQDVVLQESPGPAALVNADRFLWSKQQKQYGDWKRNDPGVLPGGWGFEEQNVFHPDVDDTIAGLEALAHSVHSPTYRQKWERGVRWLHSMQNDDGGWPAFERNTDLKLLEWIPIPGAQYVAVDPSTADITGRALFFFGRFKKWTLKEDDALRAVNWLLKQQHTDGSWLGRWGISFIYGTWAALSGLTAVGLPVSHRAVSKGITWLISKQHEDGGWGESCRSDEAGHYVPLHRSTLSQTAWALDALLTAGRRKSPAVHRGMDYILRHLFDESESFDYPTGAALPGSFYVIYHSYRRIWPLKVLVHYLEIVD